MNQLKNIALTITLLFASATAFALQEAPTQCPSVASIKATGLTFADEAMDGYGAYAESNYDTQYHWAFMAGPIAATSNQEALTKGLLLIQKLSGSPTPKEAKAQDFGLETELPNQLRNAWVCKYRIDGVHEGLAVTISH